MGRALPLLTQSEGQDWSQSDKGAKVEATGGDHPRLVVVPPRVALRVLQLTFPHLSCQAPGTGSPGRPGRGPLSKLRQALMGNIGQQVAEKAGCTFCQVVTTCCSLLRVVEPREASVQQQASEAIAMLRQSDPGFLLMAATQNAPASRRLSKSAPTSMLPRSLHDQQQMH